MAFCTNCGASMDPSAQFCPKCGKPVAATSAGAAATGTAPAHVYAAPPAGGTNWGKVLLIVGGVLCVLFVLSIFGIVAAIHHARRLHTRTFTSPDGNTVVETPFGNVSTSKGDARAVAHQIGVDVYPGAVGGESSVAQFGKMNTATLKFTTTDSLDKVIAFYKSRFPNGTVVEGNNKFNLIDTDKDGTITLNAEDMNPGTKITIAKVSGLKINVQH